MLSRSRHITLKKALEQLLFPVTCRGCELESDWLCDSCVKTLKQTDRFQCVICKKAAQSGLCLKCQTKTGLRGVIAPLDYQDPKIRQLITDLKFEGDTQIISFLTNLISKTVVKTLPDGEWTFTYVPQSLERSRERGFNQSQLLAEALGEQLFHQVTKVKHTESQVKLTKEKREKNLKGAFKVTATSPEKIIICDDVITTGSTLSQVAKVLKKAGAQEIWAITLSHD